VSAFKPRRKMRSSPEYVLTVAVAQAFRAHLDIRGIKWTHFPAGEKRTAITGAKLKRMGMQPGWPDFQIIGIAGQYIGIELKAGKGGLNENQKALHPELRDWGAKVYECRSVTEVLTVLEEEGLMDFPVTSASYRAKNPA
jgi:hypothetical protein